MLFIRFEAKSRAHHENGVHWVWLRQSSFPHTIPHCWQPEGCWEQPRELATAEQCSHSIQAASPASLLPSSLGLGKILGEDTAGMAEPRLNTGIFQPTRHLPSNKCHEKGEGSGSICYHILSWWNCYLYWSPASWKALDIVCWWEAENKSFVSYASTHSL